MCACRLIIRNCLIRENDHPGNDCKPSASAIWAVQYSVSWSVFTTHRVSCLWRRRTWLHRRPDLCCSHSDQRPAPSSVDPSWTRHWPVPLGRRSYRPSLCDHHSWTGRQLSPSTRRTQTTPLVYKPQITVNIGIFCLSSSVNPLTPTVAIWTQL